MNLIANMKKSKTFFISLIVISVFLIGSSAGLTADYYLNNEKIFNGVSVANWNLGGLTKDAAKSLITSNEKIFEKNKIKLVYNDETYKIISPNDLEIKINVEQIVDDAYSIGRKDNIFKNFKNRLKIAQEGVNLPLKFDYDQNKLNVFLTEIETQINQEPQNAELLIDSQDNIKITDSSPGKKLNKERTIANLKNSFLNSIEETNEVELFIEEIEPKITKLSLQKKGIEELVGTFTTTFNPNSLSRTHNIKTAAMSINKLILGPGEEFSFNNTVGPRSSTQGYQEAPIIVSGKLTPGIGGGVCQVSSTLYNAVLLSNLQITQRFNHSLPSSYIGLGRDATVTYGGLDFKFRNNNDNHIYMTSSVNYNTITIKIYGTKTFKGKIKIVSKVLQVIEPELVRKEASDLFMGEERIDNGSRGYKVKTWRVLQTESGEEKWELLSEDSYKSTPTTIWYGIKQPSVKPIPPQDLIDIDNEQEIEEQL